VKNHLHANGPANHAIGKGSALWKSIEIKYADELASASWLKKQRIKLRMQREFNHRRKESHEPSAATLW